MTNNTKITSRRNRDAPEAQVGATSTERNTRNEVPSSPLDNAISNNSMDIDSISVTPGDATSLSDIASNLSSTSISDDSTIKIINCNGNTKYQEVLLEDINTLKYKIAIAAIELARIHGISAKGNGDVYKRYANLKGQFKEADKGYALLFKEVTKPWESSIVPVDMLLFQWKGLTFNNKQVVFPAPTACINQFENVLRSYNLDIEANWQRLLPKQLAIGTKAWLKLYQKNHDKATWEEVRNAIKEKYGVSDTTLKTVQSIGSLAYT
ncbi:hypothetical protein BDB01DRAFT_837412 [Pilobolus umbonatus]|nr:hypothetical protein BDB01DRAFT_837412 [Pilobolus umbonatus]